jgi:hypothetical protein
VRYGRSEKAEAHIVASFVYIGWDCPLLLSIYASRDVNRERVDNGQAASCDRFMAVLVDRSIRAPRLDLVCRALLGPRGDSADSLHSVHL